MTGRSGFSSSMYSLFVVTEGKAESMGTNAEAGTHSGGKRHNLLLVCSHFLGGRVSGPRQEVGFLNSMSGPLEVHNHEFKGRPVSVVMPFSSHNQWPVCKHKADGTLDLTGVTVCQEKPSKGEGQGVEGLYGNSQH